METFEIIFAIGMAIITGFVTGIIGYAVGTVKIFREQKQNAYSEIVPPIVQAAYNPNLLDERDFTRAMNLLWLYASRKVALEWENVLKIVHNHTRGDITKALQKAIVTMRSDIQISPFQKLNPDEVNHMYTHIVHKSMEIES